MATTYQSFLAAPSTSVLAPNASINYITTTTAIHEPAAIIKHLQAQQKLITKKDEKVLSTIEGANGLCLETETTLQFKAGGGAYLPGMDENLLDERIVTFPLVHIVSFDSAGKIAQIRLHWEQGTLLKQVEAIGRTGKNWPIRDGKNLVDAVKKSVKAEGQASTGATAKPLRTATDAVANQHKRGESVSATRDPHASLALFAPRDSNDDEPRKYEGPSYAPRASAKPAPRDYGELFAGDETPSASHRSQSPTKIEGRSVKSGAGKNFGGNRIFDENEPFEQSRSPERKKTYNEKYEHFDFGDGEDAPQSRPKSGRAGGKQQSHFSFEDFSTPPKVTEKNKPDFDRHWGAEDDPPSPPKRPIVHAPRKDADPHFALSDDSPAKPLTSITNTDATRRNQDFRTDNTPNDTPVSKPRPTNNARSDMDSAWAYSSPQQAPKGYKTAGNGMGGRKDAGNPLLPSEEEEAMQQQQAKKIYKTAGDGMGGRSGTGRSWGFGEESDPEDMADYRPSARSRTAQAKGGAPQGGEARF